MSVHSPRTLNPQELLKDISDLVDDPDRWVRTPNSQLGGRQPLDLINGDDEQRQLLRDLIEAIRFGMFT